MRTRHGDCQFDALKLLSSRPGHTNGLGLARELLCGCLFILHCLQDHQPGKLNGKVKKHGAHKFSLRISFFNEMPCLYDLI